MVFISKTIQDKNMLIACVLDQEMQTFIKKSINDIRIIKNIVSAKILIDATKVRVFEYSEFNDFIEDRHHYTWDIGGDDPLDYYGFMEDEELFPKQLFFSEQYYKSKEAFLCCQIIHF